MSGALAPCGTRAAYQRHIYRGEEACEACRAACAEYTREYRKEPQALARNRESSAAHARAVKALVSNHYREFLELLAAERAR